MTEQKAKYSVRNTETPGRDRSSLADFRILTVAAANIDIAALALRNAARLHREVGMPITAMDIDELASQVEQFLTESGMERTFLLRSPNHPEKPADPPESRTVE